MYLEETSEEDYKKQQEAVKKAIKSNSGKSKTLGSMAKEMKDDPEVKKRCRLVNMIVNEAIEMYQEGDMDYMEMVEDINKSLKAVK